MHAGLALCTGALIGLTSCAVFERDNRRLLNGIDDCVSPESTATRIALAPVAVPVGTVALATDMFLVHPACMIPRAADDVYDLYWQPREMDAFRKALLFVPLVVLTPITFAGDWLLLSMFNVPRRS
ncbi:MAG: hypothetical protein U1E76_22415 [Planctomycetota bacterium]